MKSALLDDPLSEGGARRVSLVIPTYRREQVLLDTVRRLQDLDPAADEILVIDQTPQHELATSEALQHLHEEGRIRWIRLPHPSIPHAMNVGLLEARNEIVLFTDDDVVPDARLVSAHLAAHTEAGVGIVAGFVLQPWDKGVPPERRNHAISSFSRGPKRRREEFIGCNFSIRKKIALEVGGFDENFIKVAYRFENDFAERVLASGKHITFEPAAALEHLQAREGGTRSYGDFLRTIKPSHAVGEYYFLLRSTRVRDRFVRIALHPLRAVRTRHHLRRPWWIPITLIAEAWGFCWAVLLVLKGPRVLTAAGKRGD